MVVEAAIDRLAAGVIAAEGNMRLAAAAAGKGIEACLISRMFLFKDILRIYIIPNIFNILYSACLTFLRAMS
jgi:hypothetical protein